MNKYANFFLSIGKRRRKRKTIPNSYIPNGGPANINTESWILWNLLRLKKQQQENRAEAITWLRLNIALKKLSFDFEIDTVGKGKATNKELQFMTNY